jgi:hypothetical protein
MVRPPGGLLRRPWRGWRATLASILTGRRGSLSRPAVAASLRPLRCSRWSGSESTATGSTTARSTSGARTRRGPSPTAIIDRVAGSPALYDDRRRRRGRCGEPEDSEHDSNPCARTQLRERGASRSGDHLDRDQYVPQPGPAVVGLLLRHQLPVSVELTASSSPPDCFRPEGNRCPGPAETRADRKSSR